MQQETAKRRKEKGEREGQRTREKEQGRKVTDWKEKGNCREENRERRKQFGLRLCLEK